MSSPTEKCPQCKGTGRVSGAPIPQVPPDAPPPPGESPAVNDQECPACKGTGINLANAK
jgi:Ribonuclease G/E